MNLWPWALYTGTTAARAWRAKKLAADPTLCRHCFLRPAGSDDGSDALCGPCRRDNLNRWHKKYSPGPRTAAKPPTSEMSHQAKAVARERKVAELVERMAKMRRA